MLVWRNQVHDYFPSDISDWRLSCVAFRIIWRNVSELFGVVWGIRFGTIQRMPGTTMTTVSPKN